MIDTNALRELTKKGWAADCLLPKATVNMIADALDAAARGKDEPTPQKHRYFVAYSHSGHDGSFGNGWVELNLKHAIRGTRDLEYVRDLVIAHEGYKQVAITGWQRFED
jgi:hypothetical protein